MPVDSFVCWYFLSGTTATCGEIHPDTDMHKYMWPGLQENGCVCSDCDVGLFQHSS